MVGEWGDCLDSCMSECPYLDYYMCLDNCEALCQDEEPLTNEDEEVAE